MLKKVLIPNFLKDSPLNSIVTNEQITTFEKEGVVLLKGILNDFVEIIRSGIEHNITNPSIHGAENLKKGEQGRFFDDYCNWQKIHEFENVVRNSPLGQVSAELMGSQKVQVFHDHILVKEPGTSKPTPWHQDSPYYFVEGKQTISFWSPMDPVQAATLRCVAGSHKWPKPILPIRWLSEKNFYPEESDYIPVPDPDLQRMKILEWPMEPGDVVAFHFKTLHGARGNNSKNRRRAFSLRLLGDDAHYITRPGPTSPPFHGHNMKPGERLREDWFPVIYSALPR